MLGFKEAAIGIRPYTRRFINYFSTNVQTEGSSLQKALLRSVKPTVEPLSNTAKVITSPTFNIEPSTERKLEINPLIASTKPPLVNVEKIDIQNIDFKPTKAPNQNQFVQGHINEFAPKIIVII